MNTFIKSQCQNMQLTIKVFKNSVEMAATKDDGKMSSEEAKIVKQIQKISDDYIKAIQKIIEKNS